MDDLDAASSSLGQAICRLVEHGNDLETCRPGPRGQTTSGVWSALYLITVADQYFLSETAKVGYTYQTKIANDLEGGSRPHITF